MGLIEQMAVEINNWAIKGGDPYLAAAEQRLEAKLRKLMNRVAKAMNEKLKQPGGMNNPTLASGFKQIESEFAGVIESEISRMKDLPRSATKLMREHAFEASKKTLSRMRGNVMDVISKTYSEGLGPQEAARRLKQTFTGMREYELARIARNEIGGAQGLATYGRHLDNPVIDYHQWWTADDDDVRDSHADLHGEIVRVGTEFSNGLKYPKDRSGPFEEWMQCRCAVVPFIMPRGKIAPPGMTQFREGDLVEIVKKL